MYICGGVLVVVNHVHKVQVGLDVIIMGVMVRITLLMMVIITWW